MSFVNVAFILKIYIFNNMLNLSTHHGWEKFPVCVTSSKLNLNYVGYTHTDMHVPLNLLCFVSICSEPFAILKIGWNTIEVKCEACVVLAADMSLSGCCLHSEIPLAAAENIVRLGSFQRAHSTPPRRWIALLARARRPRIQDGKDKNQKKWKIIPVDARWV